MPQLHATSFRLRFACAGSNESQSQSGLGELGVSGDAGSEGDGEEAAAAG